MNHPQKGKKMYIILKVKNKPPPKGKKMYIIPKGKK